MSPDLVAPMAAFLAHEACPVSGEIYAAGAGRFARIFIASTEGYVHARRTRPSRTSPGTGRRSTTRAGTTSRPTSSAWSAAFMAHLLPSGGSAASPAADR